MRKKKTTKTKSRLNKQKDDPLLEERNLLVTEYFASKKNRQRKREIEKKIVELDTQYEQMQE